MNCRDCVEKLDGFVDRELSDAEVLEVRRHLKDCPPCEDRFHLEVEVKRLVRTCCSSDRAPDSLREKLREILG
ncbi:MAG: mycothiol system anti-sigma-R factor [Candidatus Dormibacteraceae bacterium]